MELRKFSTEETQNLRARTFTALRGQILDGSLKPGERVSERKIAEMLGISTTPIKEALRRLEAEGLVVTLPRRGTYIAAFSTEKVHEMALIRAAIEGVAARIAAQKAKDADLSQLRSQIEVMRAATAAGDFGDVVNANEGFHEIIQGLAANQYLSQILGVLRVYDRSNRVRVLSRCDEFERAFREHLQILTAIEGADPDGAEAAMRAHILRSVELIRIHSEQHGEPT
ncbi:GntR family transcriptional regulator [Mesorhizobium shangrilense]|uniref:GntR family transcriptional regulator n=1 Tax=Mesorhizobium shangrilense TaxID=460060 RepID=A0ABV2DSS5_9HYPH